MSDLLRLEATAAWSHFQSPQLHLDISTLLRFPEPLPNLPLRAGNSALSARTSSCSLVPSEPHHTPPPPPLSHLLCLFPPMFHSQRCCCIYYDQPGASENQDHFIITASKLKFHNLNSASFIVWHWRKLVVITVFCLPNCSSSWVSATFERRREVGDYSYVNVVRSL